jgi:hypothetical protein
MDYKKELKRIKKEIIAKRQTRYKKRVTKVERIIEDIDYCLCTDRDNQFKKIYSTQLEAERVAKFLYDEQGVSLMVYPCPYSSGWHLTKNF